jgi:hypothetical protein
MGHGVTFDGAVTDSGSADPHAVSAQSGRPGNGLVTPFAMMEA